MLYILPRGRMSFRKLDEDFLYIFQSCYFFCFREKLQEFSVLFLFFFVFIIIFHLNLLPHCPVMIITSNKDAYVFLGKIQLHWNWFHTIFLFFSQIIFYSFVYLRKTKKKNMQLLCFLFTKLKILHFVVYNLLLQMCFMLTLINCVRPSKLK